jgi:4-hydroxy-tetrahydrodipicolinate reductase
MITVCVNGALGRMGSTVCQAVDDDAELELISSIDINSNQDKTINGQNIYKDISTMLKNSNPDLIVDFTNRESFLTLVRSAVPKGIKIVSGSTGLQNEDYEEIEKLCDKYKCGVLSASNFAVGAILLMHLSSIAGQYFDYVDLIESHHENKIDAPSGTAISIAEAASKNRKEKFNQNFVQKETVKGTRGGDLGGVQIHSARLPGRVARHEIVFGGIGQTFTMIHDSISRDSFMPGVIMGIKEINTKTKFVNGLAQLMGI